MNLSAKLFAVLLFLCNTCWALPLCSNGASSNCKYLCQSTETFNCLGGYCELYCLPNTRCAFQCTGGNCNYICNGGDCQFSADPGPSNHTCNDGNCVFTMSSNTRKSFQTCNGGNCLFISEQNRNSLTSVCKAGSAARCGFLDKFNYAQVNQSCHGMCNFSVDANNGLITQNCFSATACNMTTIDNRASVIQNCWSGGACNFDTTKNVATITQQCSDNGMCKFSAAATGNYGSISQVCNGGFCDIEGLAVHGNSLAQECVAGKCTFSASASLPLSYPVSQFCRTNQGDCSFVATAVSGNMFNLQCPNGTCSFTGCAECILPNCSMTRAPSSLPSHNPTKVPTLSADSDLSTNGNGSVFEACDEGNAQVAGLTVFGAMCSVGLLMYESRAFIRRAWRTSLSEELLAQVLRDIESEEGFEDFLKNSLHTTYGTQLNNLQSLYMPSGQSSLAVASLAVVVFLVDRISLQQVQDLESIRLLLTSLLIFSSTVIFLDSINGEVITTVFISLTFGVLGLMLLSEGESPKISHQTSRLATLTWIYVVTPTFSVLDLGVFPAGQVQGFQIAVFLFAGMFLTNRWAASLTHREEFIWAEMLSNCGLQLTLMILVGISQVSGSCVDNMAVSFFSFVGGLYAPYFIYHVVVRDGVIRSFRLMMDGGRFNGGQQQRRPSSPRPPSPPPDTSGAGPSGGTIIATKRRPSPKNSLTIVSKPAPSNRTLIATAADDDE